MKILITGGAGFIGLHLANRLVDDGHSVFLADNFSRAVRDEALERTLGRQGVAFEHVDCLVPAEVARLPLDVDVIVHLAAIIGVVHVNERPYDVVANNTALLANMIAHARRQRDLKRFMFASTSEVYAGTLEVHGLQIPTPEETPLTLPDLSRPRTSYLLSKINGEAMCQYSGLPFTIFRPHNVYGPRMGSIHVVPGQLRKGHDAEEGASVPVPSAEQTRTFCYIDDAVEMLVRMMSTEACSGATLNLGTEGPEVTMREVAETCYRVVGKRLVVAPEPAPPGSPARRAPDMGRTTQLIGFTSQVGLEEGVRRTYEWYRDNVFDVEGVTAK